MTEEKDLQVPHLTAWSTLRQKQPSFGSREEIQDPLLSKRENSASQAGKFQCAVGVDGGAQEKMLVRSLISDLRCARQRSKIYPRTDG